MGMNKSGKYFLSFLIMVFLTQCARKSIPTGGLKDTLPPIMINASPKMNTVFFDKEKIIITFDEFIKLKDISKQLIISPPLELDKYKVKPQGTVAKKIQIQLLDSLKKETTYTFNFGESIVDNNEDNPLPFFRYALSTGPIIDSLEIRGKVTDAYERITEPYTSIHLYPVDSTYSDSTIFLKKPFYVTSTLDSVIYNFKNLRPDTYEIIAIKDVGGNYLFDQNIDKIGFLEKPITLPGDSVINFRIFKEIPNQFWTRPFFINTSQIGFGYYGEADRDAIEVKSKVPRNFRYLINKNRETDTLNFWFRGDKLDSLKFAIKEEDTTRLFNVKFKKELRDSLEISVITKSIMGLLDSFKIESNLPLVKINLDLINIKGLDSLSVPYKASLDKNYDRLSLFYDWLPNDNYKIELLPNALIDFWGNTHDTLRFSAKTKPIEDYGNIFLQILREDKDPFVLELVNLKGESLRRLDVSNESDFYEFKYLLPGNYLFRYIKDKNGNKKWDTGNYLKKIQPEMVYYSPDTIDLRANWEINQRLKIPSEVESLPDLDSMDININRKTPPGLDP
ncbi:MAG: Ig-like domain-containing protein [Bacteroidota bacterium]|nr:Ig-like domain-containing protein [Bacteroidota bacterium]